MRNSKSTFPFQAIKCVLFLGLACGCTSEPRTQSSLSPASCQLNVLVEPTYKWATEVTIKFKPTDLAEILVVDPIPKGVRVVAFSNNLERIALEEIGQSKFRPYPTSWGLVTEAWHGVGTVNDMEWSIPPGDYQIEVRYLPSQEHLDAGVLCVARSPHFVIQNESSWTVVDETNS